MTRQRIAGILVVLISGVAVYGKIHTQQSDAQLGGFQPTVVANASGSVRPDPRQVSYSPEDPSQAGQGYQAAEVSTTYGQASYGQASYAPASYAPASYDSAASGAANYGAANSRSAQSGTPAVDPANWQRQTAGDRSAAVSLPPNWRLSEVAKGSAGVDGPSREKIVLGYQIFVMPGSPNYAPYMGPEQALLWFTRSQGVQVVRVLERAPAGQVNPGGQSEFITVETQQRDGSRGKALALVLTNPMGMNIWKFQISYIAAPEEQFDAEAPTMAAIWKSWKLDGGYVQGSLDHAGEVRAQTGAMAAAHAQHTIHQWDSINQGWDQTIRGYSTVENTDTGRRVETQIGTEQQVIRNCERNGMNCREVPTNELVPPQ